MNEGRTGRWTPLHELAICAVFKNEACDLAEWLYFHEGVGVTHFYLYDDESDDDPETILAPWMLIGRVTLLRAQGRDQMAIYNDCIARFSRDARWIAFIDLDEFLFSPETRNLCEVLTRYANAPAVFVFWVLFGSSGCIDRQDGFVIDTFTSCLGLSDAATEMFAHGDAHSGVGYVTGWARDGKSIINPRKIISMGAHVPRQVVSGAVIDETFAHAVRQGSPRPISCYTLRINHYWSKSLTELAAKVRRGSIYKKDRPARDLNSFLRREVGLNGTRDETIMRFWQEIKLEKAL